MHPTGFADLRGRRLAVTPEVEFGKRLAEVAVKELTGGDLMTARHMRQDYFQFRPTHKIFMCGNHLPVIRGTDHAIWRRIMLIPFTVTFPEERQDKDLPAKLRAEAPGILNWLIEGCLEWQENGLAEPEEVTAATRAYRTDVDILGDFLNDCCVIESNRQATFADLNRAYREWRRANGEQSMTACRFALLLKARGFKKGRTMSVRFWQGLSLKEKGTC
jgi:putative DNA primase/helicase